MCTCHVSQRRDIVTGTVEPTDEECEWHSDREEEEELAVSTAFISFSLEPDLPNPTSSSFLQLWKNGPLSYVVLNIYTIQV